MNLGKLMTKREVVLRLADMPESPFPESEATFTIRVLSPRDRQRAAEAQFEGIMSPSDDGEMSPQMRVKGRGGLEFVFRHAVIAWSGILGEDGKPVRCDDRGKMLVMEWAPAVVDWIGEEHGKLAAAADSTREDELKNSPSTSEG